MPVPVSRPAVSRPTPSRRAVVRGSAWTAPLLVVSTAAPAFAASTCATSVQLPPGLGHDRVHPYLGAQRLRHDRLDQRRPRPSTPSSPCRPSATTRPTPPATSPFPPDRGCGRPLDPAITNLGGLGADVRGVRLQTLRPAAGRAEPAGAHRHLPQGSIAGPVVNATGLSFWITDIDAITTSPYSDRVELSRVATTRPATRNIQRRRRSTWPSPATTSARGATSDSQQPTWARTPPEPASRSPTPRRPARSRSPTGTHAAARTSTTASFLSDFVFTSTGC